MSCAEHRPEPANIHDGDQHDDPHDEHDHHHEHDHGAGGVLGRVTHVLSEVFGGHSHDTADQVDDALEADTAGRRALLISLAGLG